MMGAVRVSAKKRDGAGRKGHTRVLTTEGDIGFNCLVQPFRGNHQDPVRCVGPWMLPPNRASRIAALRSFHSELIQSFDKLVAPTNLQPQAGGYDGQSTGDQISIKCSLSDSAVRQIGRGLANKSGTPGETGSQTKSPVTDAPMLETSQAMMAARDVREGFYPWRQP